MTSKVEEFRQHAQQCLDAAQKIQDADERAVLLNIAQTWLRIAEQEDAAAAQQQQQQQQQQQAQPKDDKME